jgi:uncharacterized membrane protein
MQDVLTKTRSNPRRVAYMGVFTALVYVTTSISIPMPPPLGVWHMGNLVSFLSAILCGPVVGAFACGIGATLFDLWNPLWGSSFSVYAPATLIIRSSLGYVLGLIAYRRENHRMYAVLAVLTGHMWKNVGYFIYDYMLYGPAAFLDLTSLSIKSIFEVILTLSVLEAVRRKLGRTYLS